MLNVACELSQPKGKTDFSKKQTSGRKRPHSGDQDYIDPDDDMRDTSINFGKKNVKYSEEVRVHKGTIGIYPYNLNIKDKNSVICKEDDGWLNDVLIDSGMHLINN